MESKPILKGERLILRDLNLFDTKSLSLQGNDKEINFFTWYIKYPFTIKEAKKLISNRIRDYLKKKRTIYEFAITLKDSNSLIGLTSLYDLDFENRRTKVGYWLGKDYRGKGYGRETLSLMLDFAFDKLKLHKVSANTMVSNKKSNNLLKKFSFRKIGVKKNHIFLNGKFHDVYEWELLAKKYKII